MNNIGFQTSKNSKKGKWSIITVALINLVLFIPIFLIIIISMTVPPSPGEIGIAIIVSSLYTFIYPPLAVFNCIYFTIILLKKRPQGYLKIISYVLLLLSIAYTILSIFSYIKMSRPEMGYSSLPTPTPQMIKPTLLPNNCASITISNQFKKYTDTEYLFSFQYPTSWICSVGGMPNGSKGEAIYLQDPAPYSKGYNTTYNGGKQNITEVEIDVTPNVATIHDLMDPNDPNDPSTYTNITIDGLPAIKDFTKGIFYGENNSNYLYPTLNIFAVYNNLGFEFQYHDYITESLSENFVPSPDILSSFKWIKNPSSQN